MTDIVPSQEPTSDKIDSTSNPIIRYLHRANEIANCVSQFGRHPSGCVLIAPNNGTILMKQGNVDTVNDTESTLARTTCANFSSKYLWKYTLYTTFKPCLIWFLVQESKFRSY